MSAMTAVRIVLMMLMCLVTDAPGPITPLVFEHLEDGEEVQLSRRRAGRPSQRLAQTPPSAREATRLAHAPLVPRPRPATPTAISAHARKAPPPVSDPSASSASSEDH
jgi:hypothetical protein